MPHQQAEITGKCPFCRITLAIAEDLLVPHHMDSPITWKQKPCRAIGQHAVEIKRPGDAARTAQRTQGQNGQTKKGEGGD